MFLNIILFAIHYKILSKLWKLDGKKISHQINAKFLDIMFYAVNYYLVKKKLIDFSLINLILFKLRNTIH